MEEKRARKKGKRGRIGVMKGKGKGKEKWQAKMRWRENEGRGGKWDKNVRTG